MARMPKSNSRRHGDAARATRQKRLGRWLSAMAPVIAAASTAIPLTAVLANAFTSVAHNRKDADGPFRVNSTGTLPTGIVANRLYWLIVVDANTLALTTDNPATGSNPRDNQVVITAATGSGTMTLVRPTTFNAMYSLFQRMGPKKMVAQFGGSTPPQPADPYMFASARSITSAWGAVPATSGGTASSTFQYECSAMAQPMMPYALPSPRILMVNFNTVNGAVEANVGNELIVEGASIEIAGVRYPVKFNGQNGITIPDGGWAWSDPDDSIIVPPNTRWATIVATQVANGGNRVTTVQANNVLDAAIYGGLQDRRAASATASQAALVSGTGNIAATIGFRSANAFAVVAKGWVAAGKPPVHLIVGDSRGWGSNDYNYKNQDPTGVSGFIARALIDSASVRMPSLNLCIPGTAYSAVTGGAFDKRTAMLAAVGFPFTHIISQHGTNNGNGTTCITGYEAYATVLKAAGNRPIIQIDMPAKGSTFADASYGATTYANQTGVPDYANWNTWVANDGKVADAGTGGTVTAKMDGHISLVGVVSESAASTKWGTSGFVCNVVADKASGVNTLVVDARPPDDSILWLRSPTGSASGACRPGTIQDNVPQAGQYTLGLSSSLPSLSLVIPTGSVATEVYTVDLIHETINAAKKEAAAIILVKATKFPVTI